MTESRYLPQLDGVRALAILGVLVSHFTPDSYPLNRLFHFGRAGVVVFFVLSGYLITGILLRYRDAARGAPPAQWRHIRFFYGRRILRIFPIYYLTILAAVLLGYAPVRDNLLWHITYASNVGAAFQSLYLGDAGHFWSLCVEEQFYLLWPMAVVFTPPRFIRPVAVGMIAAGIIYKFIGAANGFSWVATSFMLFGCLDSLGLGALVAIEQHSARGSATWRWIGWGAGVGWPFLILLQVIRFTAASDVREEPFYQGLIDLAISLPFLPLLAAAANNATGWMATLLSWRPLRYLGKISYGVYVYHFFLRTALPAVGSALGVAGPEPGWGYFVIYSAAAVAVASVSWYFIEKPAIGLKDRLVLQPAPSA